MPKCVSVILESYCMLATVMKSSSNPKSKPRIRFCFKRRLMCRKRKEFVLFPSKTLLFKTKSPKLPWGRTSVVEQTYLSKWHLVKDKSMSGIVWMENLWHLWFFTWLKNFFHLKGLKHFSHPSTPVIWVTDLYIQSCCITSLDLFKRVCDISAALPVIFWKT